VDAVQKSYDYAERIARREARNFYYSFRFLPPLRRRSILAVYAYSRRLDDAVDSVEEEAVDPLEARNRLEQLRRLLDPPPADDPLVPALHDTIKRFGIPLGLFTELIAGMEMDLSRRRYATFEDLYLYCYRAAGVVGLICIEIFGYTSALAPSPAEKLGIAMQLTNILRDVAEDLRRGRIYLPLDDLRRFDYGEDDLERGAVDERFRSLMRFEVDRARAYFAEAEALFPLILEESRYCPVLLKRFYSKILDLIEAQDYDVLGRRPRLGLHQKLRLLAGTWLESRRVANGSRKTESNARGGPNHTKNDVT
jgi:phytoene synthase